MTSNNDVKSRFAQLFFQAASVQLESLRQVFQQLEQADNNEEARRELLGKAVSVSEQIAEHLRWSHYQLTHPDEEAPGTSRLGIGGLRVPPPNPTDKTMRKA